MQGQILMKTCSRKCKGCRGPYKLGIINKERSKQKQNTGADGQHEILERTFVFHFFTSQSV